MNGYESEGCEGRAKRMTDRNTYLNVATFLVQCCVQETVLYFGTQKCKALNVRIRLALSVSEPRARGIDCDLGETCARPSLWVPTARDKRRHYRHRTQVRGHGGRPPSAFSMLAMPYPSGIDAVKRARFEESDEVSDRVSARHLFPDDRVVTRAGAGAARGNARTRHVSSSSSTSRSSSSDESKDKRFGHGRRVGRPLGRGARGARAAGRGHSCELSARRNRTRLHLARRRARAFSCRPRRAGPPPAQALLSHFWRAESATPLRIVAERTLL
ncbi:hypothetical protein EVAR_98324_1 [Eumeta japonica]|uniref:Uncharacterized protein n=1 Tax=Eumeta variegata TaxID=151549 RepID=A0A4C1XDT6_EUMVA|nr:hypothetical protein EVAR_98324_1 [Eumeta japonica]